MRATSPIAAPAFRSRSRGTAASGSPVSQRIAASASTIASGADVECGSTNELLALDSAATATSAPAAAAAGGPAKRRASR